MNFGISFLTILMLYGEKAPPLFEEKEGVLAAEAEHFTSQELTDVRKWYLINKKSDVSSLKEDETLHYSDASNKAYLELLPDTRKTHDDKLTHGVNFTNKPGELAVLNYRVYFNNPGKYYVWVRAYSTGSEDNGIHVGIDGTWPESGQRMQWCEGKNQWTWESKQRTVEEHCGVPELIWIDVPTKGEHTISFSMREDGFEFDKWVMTKDYEKPEGKGPKPVKK